MAQNKATRKDYYAILEVSYSATEKEIVSSYRRLAKKWHPDKNKKNVEYAEKKFKEINEAYGILNDFKKRQLYDDGVSVDDPQYRNRDFDFR